MSESEINVGPPVVYGPDHVLGSVTVSGSVEVGGSVVVNPGPTDPGAGADSPTRAEVTSEIGTTMAAHVLDPAPHPAYDDIPDLTLWYRNGLL